MRNFRRFAALMTFTLGLALAAPVHLGTVMGNEQLLLIGDAQLRFTQDSSQNTLFIPEGTFLPNMLLPGTVKYEYVKGATPGVRLTFPEPYVFTLSADERRIQAIPARLQVTSAKTVNTLLSTDERAPLIVPLANAAPGTVAGQLAQMYPNLKIVVDERQRALLIMVVPADRALVKALVEYLDSPRPQVSFEAEVIQIDRNATQKLGIDYDFIFKLGFKETNIPGGLPFSIGTIARDAGQGLAMSATINLLKTNGTGEVLARPRVVSLDGVEARINATQNTPLIVTNNSVQSVQNIATGITMSLLPKVAPDGTVEVRITITVSSPTGLTSQGVPTFSSREATTVVRVRDGEPIVIGGLLQTSQLQGENKIPLLGDIPLLGNLFKSVTNNATNTDLVIIVTPRLLTTLTQRPAQP